MQQDLDIDNDGLTFELEQPFWEQGRLVAGVDEVGRGPLAGPVVAGSCVFSPETDQQAFGWVRDSKRLSHGRITEYAEQIRAGEFHEQGLLVATLGAASAREIDDHGIQQATRLAMKRSLRQTQKQLRQQGHLEPDTSLAALVDGRDVPLERPTRAVVGGDDQSPSIACGAILAKYTRDLLMERLAEQYPAFACWASDRGYASPKHLKALQEHGPIPGHHRMSFKPCSQLSLFQTGPEPPDQRSR